MHFSLPEPLRIWFENKGRGLLATFRSQCNRFLRVDAERSLGLWDEEGDIYAVLVERSGGSTRVVKQAKVNPLDSQPLKDLALRGDEMWTAALSSDMVRLRPLTLELGKRREVEQALPFQIEPELPFPLEEAVIDFFIRSRSRSHTELYYCAARRGDIAAQLEKWERLGLEPHRLTLIGVALAARVAHCLGEARRAVVYVGQHAITSCVVEQGLVLAMRSCLIPTVPAVVHSLLSLAPFREVEDLPTVVIGDKKQSWVRDLQKELGENVDLFIEEEGLACESGWSVAAGAALTGLQPHRKILDLRQGELAERRPWWRLRKQLALFASISLLAAASLYLCGRIYLNGETSATKRAYLSLVEALEEEPIKGLNSQRQLLVAARRLARERLGSEHGFPLHPDLPSASGVMGWLSSHPVLQPLEEGEGSPITIDSFHYQLVRYPHCKRPDLRYQLRLEVEFQAANSTVAREFHAALVEPNSWVDPAGEVQWGITKGGYRASFLLKDRTCYTPSSKRRGM